MVEAMPSRSQQSLVEERVAQLKLVKHLYCSSLC